MLSILVSDRVCIFVLYGQSKHVLIFNSGGFVEKGNCRDCRSLGGTAIQCQCPNDLGKLHGTSIDLSKSKHVVLI